MNRRDMLKIVGAGVVGAISPQGTDAASTQPTPPESKPAALPIERDGIQFWLQSGLQRLYPNSPVGGAEPLRLIVARNQKLSFQACFRNNKINSVRMRCQASGPGAAEARVRRVGFVPLRNLNTYVPTEEVEGVGHIPGLCPDPLYPEPSREQ